MAKAFNVGKFIKQSNKQNNFGKSRKFGAYQRKKPHTHATIKSLEKQMKQQFFWKAKPDKKTAMSIIDEVMKARKKR